MSDHKVLKTTHACPKCGNEKDLIVLPGAGVKYYYCPECYKRQESVKTAVITKIAPEASKELILKA